MNIDLQAIPHEAVEVCGIALYVDMLQDYRSRPVDSLTRNDLAMIEVVEEELERDLSAYWLWHSLVERHQGDVLGVELRNPEAPFRRCSAILADPTEPGCYRAQHYDELGFIGHDTYPTLVEVGVHLMRCGQTQEVPGTLERLSSQPVWHEATKARETRLTVSHA